MGVFKSLCPSLHIYLALQNPRLQKAICNINSRPQPIRTQFLTVSSEQNDDPGNLRRTYIQKPSSCWLGTKYLLDNIRLNVNVDSFRLGDVWFDRVPVSRKFDLLNQIDLLQSRASHPRADRRHTDFLWHNPDRAIFWSHVSVISPGRCGRTPFVLIEWRPAPNLDL